MTTTTARGGAQTAATPNRRQARPSTRRATPSASDRMTAAILRRLREQPNEFVDLAGLADGLGEDPFTIQVHLKQMARRKLVTTSFIEPSRAGAAELTERGHAWLLQREGGRPADPPVLLQPATAQTRHDGPRLPRAQVYGPGRASPDRIRVQIRVQTAALRARSGPIRAWCRMLHSFIWLCTHLGWVRTQDQWPCKLQLRHGSELTFSTPRAIRTADQSRALPYRRQSTRAVNPHHRARQCPGDDRSSTTMPEPWWNPSAGLSGTVKADSRSVSSTERNSQRMRPATPALPWLRHAKTFAPLMTCRRQSKRLSRALGFVRSG